MRLFTFKELTELPDQKIIEKFDEVASWATTVDAGTRELQLMVYLSELSRRNQERQTNAILLYTRRVASMTAVMTIMTVLMAIMTLVLVLKH